MKHVEIYTDGSCLGNPGPGGYGVVLIYQDHYRELFQGYQRTTNNRMELMAAVKGLDALQQGCRVTLYTDSTYVKNGIQQWIHNWVKKGWKTASGQAVKNVDLWQALHRANQRHQVDWQWVKGHSGNRHNERCDVIAREAASSDQLIPDPGFNG